jgi:trehalose 2-sulfotransferase
MSLHKISKLFAAHTIDQERYDKVAAIAEPAPRYLIAMTPRSGSSHLCDVIKNTNLMGRPGEMLSAQFIPNILNSAPAKDADDYVGQVMKVIRTRNGVAGMKVSWFQFNEFCGAMQDPSVFLKYRFIHLTRRDLAAQAVSLYCATESNVFHTNVAHAAHEVEKLTRLVYDYAKILQWYRHIEAQEIGWRTYFAKHNIFPLALSYEEIETDVVAVTQRIAHYIGRPRAGNEAKSESIFRKIGERRNVEWAAQFTLDFDADRRARAAAAVSAASDPAPV